MDRTEKHRLFFGLEIPQPVKQRLLSIQQPVAGARWQRADQLHLTLVFLGSVEARQLPPVCDAARNLAVKPFDLTISGVGCFGHPDHPKNLWAGAQPPEQLAGLQDALVQKLASCGFGQKKRTFRPHITLSRFEKEAGSVREILQAYREVHAGTFRVDTLSLFESVRSAQGSAYHTFERFPLAAPE